MKLFTARLLGQIALVVGAALVGTSAVMAAEADTAPASSSNLSHHDKAFFEKAAKSGMKEVAVSQAVMDHLTNPQARGFAQSMVADHTAANTELAALASRKGVTLPPDDPKIAAKWSEKTANVDKKYVDEMVEDHEKAVKLFEKTTKSEDPDVAAFAQKTLPTLQHHLTMAKDLKKAL